MSDVFNIFTMVLALMCWFFIIRKFIADRCARIKSVEAEVFDKYRAESVSKYPRALRRKNYIVVFATKDKKLSFSVSEFSYNNYKLNEKGMLKYKGIRIISFLCYGDKHNVCFKNITGEHLKLCEEFEKQIK